MSDQKQAQLFTQAILDFQSGRLDQAQWGLQKLLARQPGNVDILSALAMVEARRGKVDEAISLFRKATQIQPANAEHFYNLGVLLGHAGLTEQAAEHYRRAIALQPGHVSARNNLANQLRKTGRLSEARQQLLAAIATRPEYAIAHASLALICADLGRLDEAIVHYRRAIALDPANPHVHSNLLLALNAHESFGPVELLAEHRNWARSHADAVAAASIPVRQRTPGERIRIGYLSSDFRGHSVAFFIDRVLACHDKSKFNLFCYSTAAKEEPWTQRLKGFVENWRDAGSLDFESLAQLIRGDNLDILVDLGGHTEGSRLLTVARRVAPVQVSYLGYPNTTGMTQMDLLLTDSVIAPQGEAGASYSEKVVRLPRTFFVYAAPEFPPATQPAFETRGHITFGVLGNYMKVRPMMLDAWAEILKQVKDSHLLLKSKSLADTTLREELVEFFRSKEIEPSRIEFSSWGDLPEYLQTLARVDIALDTYPFNGHTTTCHALWMGVPIISMFGKTHASRMGKSILELIGLNDFATENTADYVSTAVNLARDGSRLRELRLNTRQRLQDAGMLDGEKFTRELEACLEKMLQG